MITFVNCNEQYDAITHGGGHHADDIFGMVIIESMLEKVRILRLPYTQEKNLKINKNAIAFDVLNGKFDHHQKGGNGSHPLIISGKTPIPYASFGLLWRAYGKEIIQKRGIQNPKIVDYIYDYIDINLVRAVDAADNGIFPQTNSKSRLMSVSTIISILNEDDDIRPEDDNKNEGLLASILLARKALEICFKDAYNSYYFTERLSSSSKSHDFGEEVYKILHPTFLQYSNKPNLQNSQSLEEDWEIAKDDICKKLWQDDYIEGESYFENYVNGLIADIKGENHFTFKLSIDKMDIFTLQSVFRSKEYYGKTYSEDLEFIIKNCLKNLVTTASKKIKSKNYIMEKITAQKGKRILILDKKAIWQDWVARNPDARSFWFVISPSDSNGWKVQPIPCKYNKNGYRKGFPTRWYGYNKSSNNDYKKEFPPDVEFIHYQGLLAITETLESAIKLCRDSFGNQENQKI